ncbi:GNAT family N-acetyltransferase [Guyparkeria sp.]|uniref:GNAT family N-acetyltransferase n=1 Tax=Guyparkeria sp. TaxID=2035736 RepID=UPI0035655E5D
MPAENTDGSRRLAVTFAITAAEREACYRLRYRVFVEEMGARVPEADDGLELDRFDPYCHHLMVRDTHSGAVVACTRILTDTQACLTGGFYSAQEFELDAIARLPGRVMEIGRTCVAPEARSGATIAVLWSGLARFMETNRFGFLIGCASIPVNDGGVAAGRIATGLSRRHLAPEGRRVTPRHPLPYMDVGDEPGELRLPPLLKAYMRLGAKIGGEPCLDEAFGCADLFILLESRDLQGRYQRHFVERRRPETALASESIAA